MPTYVYECKSCQSVFEADQIIKDAPLDTCESCGLIGTIKRVIQPVGIAFKGSGFYVNDSVSAANRSEFPGKPAADNAENSGSGEPVAQAKVESAPPAETKPIAAEK